MAKPRRKSRSINFNHHLVTMWRFLGPAVTVGVALFVFVSCVQLFYGTGFFTVLEQHHELAPWISGLATSTGVIVALWNANRQLHAAAVKEAADDARNERNRKREERAINEAAVGTVRRAVANAEFLLSQLTDDRKFLVILQMNAVTDGLNIAAEAMGKFPTYKLQRAVSEWYKIETPFRHVISILSEARQMCEDFDYNLEKLSDSKPDRIKTLKDRTTRLCKTMIENEKTFSSLLGIRPAKNNPSSKSRPPKS